MKKLIIIICSFFVFGCGLQSSDISQLEGFWEIQSVKTDGKVVKTFKASFNIDHYAFGDSLSGVFQKVVPQFDGNFKASENQSVFSIRKEDHRWWIYQKNLIDSFRMQVVTLTKDKLILRKDSTTTEYTYRRFEPIMLQEE